MTVDSQHELDFGGIDLTGHTSYGDIRFHAMAEGATLGNAVPEYKDIISALQDGTVVTLLRHGNRTPSFNIHIEATDSALLDIGQAMLVKACGERPILGWRPPDGHSPRRIIRCFVAHAERDYETSWDLTEHPRIRSMFHRRFNLRIQADPWMYDESPTAFAAAVTPPVTPSTTVLADGSVTTGWTSPVGAVASPSVVSGRLKVAPRSTADSGDATAFGVVSEATLALSAVNFSTTQYVSVDIKPFSALMELSHVPENATSRSINKKNNPAEFQQVFENGLGDTVAAYVDGTKLPLQNYVAKSDGFITFTWTTTDASASSLRIVAGTSYVVKDDPTPPTAASRGVLFDNVTRSNVRPGQNSTGRISSQAVLIDGSARTSASVTISNDSGLGKVIYLTSPVLGKQGFWPACRPYLSLTGLTNTTDTTMVSGSRTRANPTEVLTFNIPASRIPPGAYGLVAKFRFIVVGGDDDDSHVVTTVSHVVNGTTFWSTEMPVKPVLLGGSSGGTKAWQMVNVGIAALPPNEIPASDTSTSFIRIAMAFSSGEDEWELDELFLIPQGDGSDITEVDCGTGTPSVGTVHNYLWIDGPTPLDPKPRLYVGTQADRSDAFNPGYPKVTSYGIHPVLPGENQIYVICTGDNYPVVSGTYTKAYA